jgi:hypothetical protein
MNMQRKSFFKIFFGGIAGLCIAPKAKALTEIASNGPEFAQTLKFELCNQPIEAGLWYPQTKLWRYGSWNLLMKLRDAANTQTELWDFREQKQTVDDFPLYLKRVCQQRAQYWIRQRAKRPANRQGQLRNNNIPLT